LQKEGVKKLSMGGGRPGSIQGLQEMKVQPRIGCKDRAEGEEQNRDKLRKGRKGLYKTVVHDTAKVTCLAGGNMGVSNEQEDFST